MSLISGIKILTLGNIIYTNKEIIIDSIYMGSRWGFVVSKAVVKKISSSADYCKCLVCDYNRLHGLPCDH